MSVAEPCDGQNVQSGNGTSSNKSLPSKRRKFDESRNTRLSCAEPSYSRTNPGYAKITQSKYRVCLRNVEVTTSEHTEGMSVTLGDVLQHFGRSLQIRSASRLGYRLQERAIQAVSFTNLINPAPFLSNQTLILTTGNLLEQKLNPFTARSYLRNMMIRDVPAVILGPEQLDYSRKANVDALERRMATADYLSTFEGARKVPIIVSSNLAFIEMTRAINSMIEVDAAQEELVVSDAKRQLNLAAFSSTSIPAITDTLETLLGTWVMCFDNSASMVGASPLCDSQASGNTDGIQFQVHRLLLKGSKATHEMHRSHGFARAESFGPTGKLLGVLVHGRTNIHSTVVQHIVSHAIFLLEALLQGLNSVNDSEHRLNSAILRLLLSGSDAEVARTITIHRDDLPEEPFVVAEVTQKAESKDDNARIRRAVSLNSRGEKPFLASYHHRTLLLLRNKEYPFTSMFPEGCIAGVSSPTSYENLKQGIREAEQCLEEARHSDKRVVRYQAIRDITDVTDYLQRCYDRLNSSKDAITMLDTYDVENHTTISDSLRCWLDCNCSWSKAAARLGIHRHTLQHHVSKASELLDVDFADARTRIAIWFCLQQDGSATPQKS